MIYNIELTETENKAMSMIAEDVKEWILNAVKNRARIAEDEIVKSETARLLADPDVTTITANRETLIMNAVKPKIAELPISETTAEPEGN